MRPLCAPSHLYGRTCGARVSFLCDCDGGAKHVLNLGFGGGRVAGVASSAAVLDRYLEDHEEKEGVGRAVFWSWFRVLVTMGIPGSQTRQVGNLGGLALPDCSAVPPIHMHTLQVMKLSYDHHVS